MILGLNPRSLCKAITDKHPRGKAVWFDAREWKTDFLKVLGEWRCHQGIILVKDQVRLGKAEMVDKPKNTFLLEATWAIARETMLGTATVFHHKGAFWIPTDQEGSGVAVTDPGDLAACWAVFNYALMASSFAPKNEEAAKVEHPRYAMEASEIERFPSVQDERTWNYYSPNTPPKWEAKK